MSDRIEKLDYQSDPLKTLEKNSKYITRDDWNLHLDESITSDLRKYRAYQGSSVRDLLRALRNKVKWNISEKIFFFTNFDRILSFLSFQKHHYHELTPETQARLGALPTAFTKYWIDRFPRLVSHSYHALSSCSEEHVFTAYYPSNEYKYSKPNYFYEETEDFKPFDNTMKARDSPKRMNFRYTPMDYPNFVMDRKPRAQNNNINNNGDASNKFPYLRSTKKGSYNFHRSTNNLNNGSNGNNINNGNVQQINIVNSNSVENNHSTNQRLDGSTAMLVEVPIEKSEEVDEEGFTKVRYRGQPKDIKKQREHENIRWVVPNRDDKENK